MDKNRIEIRGVIVPSEYDQEFMWDHIRRGLITPESRIRRAIGAADPTKDLNIYINSQGGSVFAGNEMINAVLDWKNQTFRNINVTVGALAASMGSSIAISVADNLKVHANSKIMFHGAWGGVQGGSQAMSDYAEVLEKINSDIKIKLINRYNLSPDIVDEWFAEGREGWLNAYEAKAIGMADEIIGENDELPETVNNIDSMLKEKGMKIAALALNKAKQEKNAMEKLLAKLKSMLGIKGEVSEESVFELLDKIEDAQGTLEEIEETEDVCEEPQDESDATEPSAESEETEELSADTDGDVEADGDEEEADDSEAVDVVEEEVQDLNEVCIELEAKTASLNDALNKKQSENDKLKSDIHKLANRLEKFLGNGFSFNEEESAPTDWKSCLEKCDGDYVQARKEFPGVFAKYISK